MEINMRKLIYGILLALGTILLLSSDAIISLETLPDQNTRTVIKIFTAVLFFGIYFYMHIKERFEFRELTSVWFVQVVVTTSSLYLMDIYGLYSFEQIREVVILYNEYNLESMPDLTGHLNIKSIIYVLVGIVAVWKVISMSFLYFLCTLFD
jgi:hypothetical protein